MYIMDLAISLKLFGGFKKEEELSKEGTYAKFAYMGKEDYQPYEP